MFNKILVAIDGSDPSARAGLYAAQYGHKLKGEIKHLVKKHSKEAYTESKVETFIS